jgi:hypothetical protein
MFFSTRKVKVHNQKRDIMRSIQKSSKLIVLTLVIISAFSCQSKKKAMQASAAAAEKARIEQEAADKKKAESEAAARKAEEEKLRLSEEQRLKEQRDSEASAPSVKVSQYFNSISTSTNTTSANASINEALTLFASPETPVFIVISDSGGIKDYDKPTTIKDYLNYLKDQKKNINAVSSLKTDGNGKITELELRKN